MKGAKFIEKMFGKGRTTGNIILVSLANDRDKAKVFPSQLGATRDPKVIDGFLNEFDKPGRAMYFGCNTMSGRNRNKEEIAEINSLYIDIDFKGVVQEPAAIYAALNKLKLKPSVVVESGHGLHCYWLLAETLSVEHSASCEDIMRRICAVLAGDTSACEVARVLRMPGSHNSKNGEWIEVCVNTKLSRWNTYRVDEIDEYFSDMEDTPLLTYKPTKRDLERDNAAPLNVYQAFGREMRELSGSSLDINEALDEMTFHSVQGNGIDDTMTKVVGAMVREGKSLDSCVAIFLKPMQRVYERDMESGESKFNERRAIRDIRAKYRYFMRKDKNKKRDDDDDGQDESEDGGSSEPEQMNSPPPSTKKKDKAEKAEASKPAKKVSSNYDFDPGADDEEKENASSTTKGGKVFESEPHDFWKLQPTENIRTGMVPKIIEDVGFEYADRNGFDRHALIMSMLTVASSVIATDIKVAAYNESDNKFIESIRIWTANVGVAGSGKSPILNAIRSPIDEIEKKMRKEFNEAMEDYNAHSKEEQREMDRPVRERMLIPTDVSTESVQMSFADNPDGMLGAYDELVTFFGSKQRYSGKGNGGEQTSRGFWLTTYDSSHFSLTRVNRAEIDCKPSCSIVGGIQPTVLRDLLDEVSRNDGIVQRFNPVIMPDEMRPPNKGINPKYPITVFEKLIKDMYYQCPLRLSGTTLHFSPKAEIVRDRMFEWIREQVKVYNASNPQLSAHINKYRGMFLRFCGLFHMIENFGDRQPRQISADTANMAYRFMTSVRVKHAECFYGMIIENEETEDLRNIANFILSHNLSVVSAREIQRGAARFRNISTRDIAHTVGNMISLGWLDYSVTSKRVDSYKWKVNPNVHKVFRDQADKVKSKNADTTERLAILRAEKEAEELPPEKLN